MVGRTPSSKFHGRSQAFSDVSGDQVMRSRSPEQGEEDQVVAVHGRLFGSEEPAEAEPTGSIMQSNDDTDDQKLGYTALPGEVTTTSQDADFLDGEWIQSIEDGGEAASLTMRANGDSPSKSGKVFQADLREEMKTSHGNTQKYKVPVDMNNANDLKERIAFKQEVVTFLRESCDREILEIQQEIHVLQEALEAKRRPPPEVVDAHQPRDSGKMKIIAQVYNPKPKATLTLQEAYAEALIACRRAKVQRGEATSIHEEPEWWRNRDFVDKKALDSARHAAVCGLLGTGCAIFQNELVYMEVDPKAASMEALKMINTCATFLALVCVYRLYWFKILIFRINRHCRRLTPLDTQISFRDLCSEASLWMEVIVIGVHCPPFYTYEYDTDSFGNIILYRAETLGALFNVIRIYLVWRYYRDFVLYNIQKRHTIASFTGAKFGTSFVLKHSLTGWHTIPFIVIIWTMAIFLCAYVYRAAEISACFLKTTKSTEVCSQPRATEWQLYDNVYEHHNEVYIWDALWLMYITTMTIGYGDISPSTHYGRVCAAVVLIMGICLASILTAAMMTNLQWEPEELATLRILERARFSEDVKTIALAKLERRLKTWLFERRKRKKTVKEAQALKEYKTGFAAVREGVFIFLDRTIGITRRLVNEEQELTTQLRRMQHDLSRDISSFQSEESKYNHIFSRCKYMERAVSSIHERLEDSDVFDSLLDARARKRQMMREEMSSSIQHNSFAAMINERERHRQSSANFSEHIKASDGQAKPSKEEPWKKAKRVRKQIALCNENKYAMTEMQRKAKQMKKEKLCELIEKVMTSNSKRKWNRDKDLLIRRLDIVAVLASIIGTSGTLLSMVQNEMVLAGFGSVDQLNLLKCINSVCSLACVFLVVNYYWLHTTLEKILRHVHHFRPLDVTDEGPLTIIKNPFLWIEIFLVGIHCPPYVNYQYGVLLMGNFTAYRIETMFACLNLLRLYLLWRSFSGWMMADLPKRTTLAGFAKVRLDSTFIFKRMLNSWASVLYISCLWIISTCVFGYWFRCAELTACQFPRLEGGVELHPGCVTEAARIWTLQGSEFEKINDYWLQHACWHMFVTATTVGYGEVQVTTHFGRLVCAICGLVGMLLNALIIAALSQVLMWNENEVAARRVIERETERRDLKRSAVSIIETWWKTMVKRWNGVEIPQVDLEDDRFQIQLAMETLRDLRNKLNREHVMTSTEMLDQITKKTKKVEELIELIAYELWSDDMKTLVSLHATWEEKADLSRSAYYKRRTSELARAASELPGDHGTNSPNRTSPTNESFSDNQLRGIFEVHISAGRKEASAISERVGTYEASIPLEIAEEEAFTPYP